jgi:hypothetical protein
MIRLWQATVQLLLPRADALFGRALVFQAFSAAALWWWKMRESDRVFGWPAYRGVMQLIMGFAPSVRGICSTAEILSSPTKAQRHAIRSNARIRNGGNFDS